MKPDFPGHLPGFDVLRRIEARGFPAFLVGGVVRDLLRGRAGEDVDIVTLAPPEVLRRLFAGAPEVGKAPLGVWVVPWEGGVAEVASCHPHSLEEDLARRDFTVNALALGVDGQLVDRSGGMEDLFRRRLRWNGDPRDRLRQDPLRALRLARFAATLPGWSLDPGALAPCVPFAGALGEIPGERVGREMARGLRGDPVLFLNLLERGGMLGAVWPELGALRDGRAPGERGDLLSHTLRVLGGVASRSPVLRDRAGALWHDGGRGVGRRDDDPGAPSRDPGVLGARRAARRMALWRWPRSLGRSVKALVRHHSLGGAPPSPEELGRLVRRHGMAWLEGLLTLFWAHGQEGGSFALGWEAHRREVLALRSRWERWAGGRASGIGKVSGDVIRALTGLPPGPAVGALKARLEEAVDRGEVTSEEGARIWLRRFSSEGVKEGPGTA